MNFACRAITRQMSLLLPIARIYNHQTERFGKAGGLLVYVQAGHLEL